MISGLEACRYAARSSKAAPVRTLEATTEELQSFYPRQDIEVLAPINRHDTLVGIFHTPDRNLAEKDMCSAQTHDAHMPWLDAQSYTRGTDDERLVSLSRVELFFYLAVDGASTNGVWLGYIARHPDKQYRGVGKAVFCGICSFAVKRGYRNLTLDPTSWLDDYWRHLGGKTVSGRNHLRFPLA